MRRSGSTRRRRVPGGLPGSRFDPELVYRARDGSSVFEQDVHVPVVEAGPRSRDVGRRSHAGVAGRRRPYRIAVGPAHRHAVGCRAWNGTPGEVGCRPKYGTLGRENDAHRRLDSPPLICGAFAGRRGTRPAEGRSRPRPRPRRQPLRSFASAHGPPGAADSPPPAPRCIARNQPGDAPHCPGLLETGSGRGSEPPPPPRGEQSTIAAGSTWFLPVASCDWKRKTDGSGRFGIMAPRPALPGPAALLAGLRAPC